MYNHMNNHNRFLAATLVMALATIACSINLKSPITQIKTGPTQTTEIQVPMPVGPATDVELNLEFMAGELTLAPAADPGANEYLASGTASFNAAEFEPKVEATGATYTLRSGDMEIEGIPKFQDDFINEWDLQLSKTPMSLSINAGAYSGGFELGGLSLEKLAISEGGSEVACTFSSPNLVVMSSFTYNTGGSTMVLKGLANANFEQMTFNAGSGEYTLSFNGDLQRDANVMIDAGVSTMNIIVPEGTNAKITFDGGLSSVNAGGGWEQHDKIYTLSGSGPTISITVKMGVGTLNLKT